MRPESSPQLYYHEPETQRKPETHTVVPELVTEVARIRRKGPREEVLYLLPDTGFNVPKQIDLLVANVASGLSLEDSFEQVEQDVQGFKVEYLMEGVLFPIVLNKTRIGEGDRIQATFYGGKLWADAVSEQERDGVIKSAITGGGLNGKAGIEEHLLNAPPGSMAVLISPPEWSGYPGIEYHDTQVYAIEVLPDGRLCGFAIKSDINIDQNEKLAIKLGLQSSVFEEKLSENERIKRVINNYVLLNPSENRGGIKWAIDEVNGIKGSDVAFVDSKGRQRMFSEAYKALKDPESLWTLDDFTRALIGRFKDQVLYEFSKGGIDRRNLEIGLGRVILELADRIRGKNQKVTTGQIDGTSFDPRAILADVQSIPGCAGGCKVNSLTPRMGIEGKRILFCTCPFCGKEVEAVIEGGTISCPKCQKSAPWIDEEVASGRAAIS